MSDMFRLLLLLLLFYVTGTEAQNDTDPTSLQARARALARMQSDWFDKKKHPKAKLSPSQELFLHKLGAANAGQQARIPLEGRQGGVPTFAGRVRKEYRQLTANEMERFHRAMNMMKNSYIDGMSQYDIFVSYHTASSAPTAHFTGAFLPYHRELLTRCEQALNSHIPGVSLAYLDMMLDRDLADPMDSVLWMDEFLGNCDGPVTTGFARDWVTSPGCGSWRIERGAIPGTGHWLMTDYDFSWMLGRTRYEELCWNYDEKFESDHGSTHVWIGGHMLDLTCSPCDPCFYMHHAFVDCMWERFRTESQRTNPETEYPFSMFEEDATAILQPFFPKRIIEGLSREYTRLHYRCQPSPRWRNCNADSDCGSPQNLLWCNPATRRCTSKIKPGGYCGNFGTANSCYCPRNRTPSCNRICRCR